MKVVEFDISKGIYRFEVDHFSTEAHAHPAMEVVMATQGRFNLSAEGRAYNDISFAIIDANVVHSLSADNCELAMLMIEHNEIGAKKVLVDHGVELKEQIYTKVSTIETTLLGKLSDYVHQNGQVNAYEDRVKTCLDAFEAGQLEYTGMINELKDRVYLSESRLSHLFKAHVGISLKKYLVWCRLKQTIHSVLENKESLATAGLRHGFYDQAHMSKAFKEMLGINPSFMYNSSILQG